MGLSVNEEKIKFTVTSRSDEDQSNLQVGHFYIWKSRLF